MNHAIESRKAQLDAYFGRAKKTSVSDETRSDLATHGIVLVCGFVERSVELVVLEKLQNKAHPRVLKFIRGHFKRGTNYDCEAIAQLFERFDTEWCFKFRTFKASRDDIVSAIASAYALRNAIAHGSGGSMGLIRVTGTYELAKELVDGMIVATS